MLRFCTIKHKQNNVKDKKGDKIMKTAFGVCDSF